MRSVLFVLALLVVCVSYEFDRDAKLAPAWVIAPPGGNGLAPYAPARGAALRGGMDAGATGSIEREQSIRLFGPGVSRKQQIRV